MRPREPAYIREDLAKLLAKRKAILVFARPAQDLAGFWSRKHSGSTVAARWVGGGSVSMGVSKGILRGRGRYCAAPST